MISIEQLNTIRKQNKIPGKTIAKALRCSNTNAFNLLSGKSQMTVKQLITCCKCIGIDIAFTYPVNP